jgi:hypothetical protein
MPDSNPSNIELLTQYAKNTQREISSQEIPYYGTIKYPVVSHKRIVIIPESVDNQVFLIAFSNPKSISDDSLFMGIFIPFSKPIFGSLEIRKRYFFDSLNLFNRHKTLNTSFEKFNKRVVISGDAIDFVREVVDKQAVQMAIEDALNIDDAFFVGLNKLNLDFVPEFENKSSFGFYTRQKWYVEHDFLERMFAIGRDLKKHF